MCNAVSGVLNVLGTVQGHLCTMLIDSGSSATLVSDWFAEIDLDLSPMDFLPPSPEDRLSGASGEPLEVIGSFVAHFSLGAADCSHRVRVVRGLSHDCIVGRDLLGSIQCSFVSDGNGRLQFFTSPSRTSTVPTEVASVHAVKLMVIPPFTEQTVQGRIRRRGGHSLPDICLVEPNQQASQCGTRAADWLTANALVTPTCGAENDTTTVAVSILNPTDRPLRIQRKARLGTLTEVAAVFDVPTTSVPSDCNPGSSPAECLLPNLHINTDHLSASEVREVNEIVAANWEVFAHSSSDLGRTHLTEMRIDTGDHPPIRQLPRRMSPAQREQIAEHVNTMLNQGVIEPSASPWSSPVVHVKKKDGSTRFCVDFRRLNGATKRDAFPLPRIDDTLDALGGARYFSTLDLCSGYFQIPVAPDDREKTAFSTRDGHYQFTSMPFGCCNGPSHFQRLMSLVLSGLQWRTCLVYLDDVIVFGRTFQEHQARLKEVFDRLRSTGLKLMPSKCHLFCERVTFLGHVISAEGVQTDIEKVDAVRSWPCPTNVPAVRAFLGFCSYYRCFVQGFATRAAPLYELTRKAVPFIWDRRCQAAFDDLRAALTSTPVLAFPIFAADAGQFVLDVDASGFGLGAVLSQHQNGHERVIAFASRVLSDAETRYPVTKRELLAATWAMRHFRCYLLGREFLVRSDHKALEHLVSFKDPPPQIARWLQELSEFDYQLEYRPGTQHANADGLSRSVPSLSAPAQPVLSVGSCPADACGRWTSSDWTSAQQEDPELARVRQWILPGPLPEHELTGLSPSLRHFWRNRSSLEMQDGVLCRRWHDPDPSRPSFLQIVVPRSLRARILTAYHDTAGHFGEEKTTLRLRAHYHWYGMHRDTVDWVRSCTSCSRRKRTQARGRGAPLVSTWCGHPWERLALDLIPNLPVTARGNRNLLVVVDYFSKRGEAFAIPDMTAATIARVITDEIVARFGAPASLHSDQGRNVDSALTHEICSLLGTKKTRTTAYHPASDGLVERLNQTLEQMLSHVVSTDDRDWDVRLPSVMMAYRSAVQSSTGYTPHYRKTP